MQLNKINWKNLRRVLVAIDAANLEHSAKDLKFYVRYQALKEYFIQHTTLVMICFYSARFGSKSHDRFLTFLKKRGFRLVTKQIKVIQDTNNGEKRKADFDVEITADCVIKMKEFDTLVLFSGDSDFDYLIKLLKAHGKKVIVVSSRFHVSRELVASCTHYLDLKKFKNVFLSKIKSPSFATGD